MELVFRVNQQSYALAAEVLDVAAPNIWLTRDAPYF